jgi:DNA-binding IscR family transcriptional regulator
MSATEKRPVAAHVLRHLARAKQRGRAVRLDELAKEIGVRRDDVRDVVTSLDAEGHVDARRMRLTMSGFAMAVAMRECKLRDARIRLHEPMALPQSA